MIQVDKNFTLLFTFKAKVSIYHNQRKSKENRELFICLCLGGNYCLLPFCLHEKKNIPASRREAAKKFFF